MLVACTTMAVDLGVVPVACRHRSSILLLLLLAVCGRQLKRLEARAVLAA